MELRFARLLDDVGLDDVSLVGGKNAALGELRRVLSGHEVRVPDGFAVTSEGYRAYVAHHRLEGPIRALLAGRRDDEAGLRETSRAIRALFEAPLPVPLEIDIAAAYAALGEREGVKEPDVAVRSSATAEDLPQASFAGQQESFLNVRGAAAVIDAVRRCYASLFTARAIHYREDMRFDPLSVALSAGVQRMVRSDLGSAGVLFTLDPDSGHRGVVVVTSAWGLGEGVVQGRVGPDQFVVHKRTLAEGFRPIVSRRPGTKERRVVFSDSGVREEAVSPADRERFSLDDDDVLALARTGMQLEAHFRSLGRSAALDVEWARDGRTGTLFVVQARPETVHVAPTAKLEFHRLDEQGERLVSGQSIGEGIGSGPVRVVRSPSALAGWKDGDVLVAPSTDPDWEPIMRRASALVTERGGRTSHAAIIARELGIPAVVGAPDAMARLGPVASVTVSCAEGATGHVYRGLLKHHREEVDLETLPKPRTKLLVNLADPSKAFGTAQLPCDGVGLLRMEFVFAGWIGIHPLALTRYAGLPDEVRREVDRRTGATPDRTGWFVGRLAEGIGTIAAAFHPRPVVLRFSDFKTNEYARLVGGALFEPREENPMLGWRGASRYTHPDYREGFRLEMEAVRKVRDTFGLKNLELMIPFCRTPDEGRRVVQALAEGGLVRGRDGLRVHVMAEIPSNILLADAFARDFDGFSIGSNDLTQLTLGIDRDSATVAPLFDERNPAVRWSCARLIERAHAAGRTVSICGQAPSDFPDFAAFLVENGIDALSVTPDVLVRTLRLVGEVEARPPPARPSSLEELTT